MKILLTAINAKYIHSNLAVYSLREYAVKEGHHVTVSEYTINQRADTILAQIYLQKPDVLVFSCYIWNIELVIEIAEEFHKVCPQVPIWAGGPEVSFETEIFLHSHPAFFGAMMGEGERTFSSLAKVYERDWGDNHEMWRLEAGLSSLDGIAYRRQDGRIAVQPLMHLLDMDQIPFCYEHLEDFSHRIIYYESSRGCPFHCSYCLSSVDKTLRFRSLHLVFRELQFFLDHKVPQVKFVDRTFNCRHDHAEAVWRYILEHDNGVTNFHFEVSADLLNQQELELMAQMRPGLIQLEIGVQTTHGETIREIHRTMRLPQVHDVVQKIQAGRNIHQHLDLIAGLPLEDYQTFQKSFDELYSWKPDQLQLGFLKVLKGSYMYDHAKEYGMIYRTHAPYEILATRWLSFGEILEIHLVEEMLEQTYNSGQFRTALMVLEQSYDSAFQMFLDMGHFYREKGYLDSSHSRVQKTEMFLEFACEVDGQKKELYQEALLFDLYRIEKSKSRPAWAADLSGMHRQITAFLRKQGLEKKYCHVEPFRYLCLFGEEILLQKNKRDGEQWILFDYEQRNPLTNEASRMLIQMEMV